MCPLLTQPFLGSGHPSLNSVGAHLSPCTHTVPPHTASTPADSSAICTKPREQSFTLLAAPFQGKRVHIQGGDAAAIYTHQILKLPFQAQ